MIGKKYRPLLISVIIVIISLVYYLSYFKYFKIDVDEGLLINGAMRVLSGELPLKDFHQYTMGRFYLLAFWFFVFGKSIAVERLLFAGLHIVKTILAYHVARRLMPLPFCLIPSALLLLIPGFWNKAFVGVILLVNTIFILSYLNNQKEIRLFALGLSVGFAVYFREDIAGYSFITAAVLILVLGISKRTGLMPILKKWVILGFSVLLAVLPMILIYLLRDGLTALWEGIIQTVKLGHIESYVFKSPLEFLKWPIDIKDRGVGLAFPYFTLILFAVFALILFFRFLKKSPGEQRLNFSLFSIWGLAVLSFMHIAHWTHEFRTPQSGALIHILWAYLACLAYFRLKKTWIRKGPFFPAKMLAVSGVLIIILSIQVFLVYYCFFGHPMVQYDGGGISLKRGLHQEIEGTDRSGILPPARQAVVYSHILQYLDTKTAYDDQILCFGESPLYFLSKRTNATEFDNGRIPGYFPKRRRTFLSQIKARKPKIIVLRQWEYKFWYPKMPEVLDYITSAYFLDRKIGSFYIFDRVENLDFHFRKGNVYYFKKEIERATAEYLKALAIRGGNRDVQKILTRLFSNPTLSEKSLPVLDGYCLLKKKNIWRLRWGSARRQKFSGTVRIGEGENMKDGTVDIVLYPENGQNIKVERSENQVSFVSEIAGGVGGLEIAFTSTPRSLSIQLELRQEGERIERIFVSGKGFVPAETAITLMKQQK